MCVEYKPDLTSLRYIGLYIGRLTIFAKKQEAKQSWFKYEVNPIQFLTLFFDYCISNAFTVSAPIPLYIDINRKLTKQEIPIRDKNI